MSFSDLEQNMGTLQFTNDRLISKKERYLAQRTLRALPSTNSTSDQTLLSDKVGFLFCWIDETAIALTKSSTGIVFAVSVLTLMPFKVTEMSDIHQLLGVLSHPKLAYILLDPLSDSVLVKDSPMRETNYVSTGILSGVNWQCEATAVYKVYSITAPMLAYFQEMWDR
ncbi:hypothetical protein Bca4012_012510 [Brassica carinata]